MATTIYSRQGSYETWDFPTHSSSRYDSSPILRYPYPRFSAVKVTSMNKVWDSVANGWIMWESNYPDIGGKDYPGPGDFGIDTSDYHHEAIVHGRQQL